MKTKTNNPTMNDELRDRAEMALQDVELDCPECEGMEDDQYQCTTCGHGGGQGTIGLFEVLSIKENRNAIFSN